jgi:hypothetical protein
MFRFRFDICKKNSCNILKSENIETIDLTLLTYLDPSEHDDREVFPIDQHFACPNKGCGNQCPGDHEAGHCHGFAILLHTCGHHCAPCHKCDKCGKPISNVCKCYNCGRCFGIDCCFK